MSERRVGACVAYRPFFGPGCAVSANVADGCGIVTGVGGVVGVGGGREWRFRFSVWLRPVHLEVMCNCCALKTLQKMKGKMESI